MSGFYIVARLGVLFAFIGFILWLVSRKVRTQDEVLKLHLEGRNRLLERFADANALVAFAATTEGRALLQPPDLPLAEPRLPAGVRMVQSGIVALALGGGFEYLGASWIRRADLARGNFLDSRLLLDGQGYEMAGVLLLCGGAGLIIAGLLAWWWQQRDARPRR